MSDSRQQNQPKPLFPRSGCSDEVTLAAYVDGGLPAETRLAFEAHLALCADCALAVREVSAMRDLPPEPLRPKALARIHAAVLAAVQQERAARNELERERKRVRRVARSWRFAFAAACFAVILAIPAVVQMVRVASSNSPGARKPGVSASSRGGETPLPEEKAEGPARLLGPIAPAAGAAGEQAALRAKQPTAQELANDLDMKQKIDELVAYKEVEVMLPHTDTEYEAWAREEYPHIMWLYDVLSQPQYGIEWNGEPASVPAWADRLYADVPAAERPRGWRALVVYSGEALRFDYPTEPGQPNVRPRLEAVQLAAAVAGFDAKFAEGALAEAVRGNGAPAASGGASAHNPPGSTLSTPSTVLLPKNGAGKSGEGASASTVTSKRLPLPALTWAEQGDNFLAMSAELFRSAKTGRVVAAAANEAPVPVGYFAAVSARPDTTQSILRYAAVSDLVVGTPATTSLSREAQALLLNLASLDQMVTRTPSCTMVLPSTTLESLFSARRGLLANSAAQEGGSR